MPSLFYIILILNSIAFLITGYDKQLAIQQKRRISEKTLLGFAFFGGSIGSGLAMLIFRHKTSKRSYLLKVWMIILIQILAIGFYFNK